MWGLDENSKSDFSHWTNTFLYDENVKIYIFYNVHEWKYKIKWLIYFIAGKFYLIYDLD